MQISRRELLVLTGAAGLGLVSEAFVSPAIRSKLRKNRQAPQIGFLGFEIRKGNSGLYIQGENIPLETDEGRFAVKFQDETYDQLVQTIEEETKREPVWRSFKNKADITIAIQAPCRRLL